MKGAASRDRPRGGANGLRSGGARMGEPAGGKPLHLRLKKIGRQEATRGTETSKYPEERKSTETPRVAASESGKAQTRASVEAHGRCRPGVAGRDGAGPWSPRRGEKAVAQRNGMGRPAAEGDSPVREAPPPARSLSRVARDTRNPARSWGDRPPRLSTLLRPIANQYREGKVKSTPRGE